MRSAPLFVPLLLLGASCTSSTTDDTELVASNLRDPDVTAPARRDVMIIRDDMGVPHVHAHDLRALFYGNGYAQGQDRLWQAETLRRAATGRLAEWFGPPSLPSDIQARLVFGPPERRAALLDDASPETRLIFESFVDGLNAWIDEASATGKLPHEYAAFGVEPEPWAVDDSLAVFMLLGSQFGWFGGDDLAAAVDHADLVARLGPVEGARAFADTHFLDDPSAPTTIPPTGPPGAPAAANAPVPPPRTLPGDLVQVARELGASARAQKEALARVGLRRGPMSNAILIGASRSADGHALLLGGPQMGYGAPQINHEMGLHGAGFDVTGMQIAGFPLVPIGVGRDYAWTLTSGGSDNTDFFIETLNPANPLQYRHQDAWRDLDCRVETFHVVGGAPTGRTLCRSVHGPIVAMTQGSAYAMANSTFGSELASYQAWLNMGRVRSFEDFRANLEVVAYNFNVFYADTAGHIGYWHVGKIPVRAPGAVPFFPQPGDGSSDWQGVIPFADMPQVVNPAQGWLVNWNNKPEAGWANSSAGFWDWGPVHRVNTLRHLIAQQLPERFTPATLATINQRAGLTTDSPSGAADVVIVSTMLGPMVDAVDTSADPRLDEVAALLRGWDWLQTDVDGDEAYDSPAVAVFNAWWQATLESLFFPKLGTGIDPTLCAQILYRLLGGNAGPVRVLADYLDGATVGEALTASLVAALDELTATFGTADMEAWQAPQAGIVWRPGGIGTVASTPWMNRGTYNQIVHLGHGARLTAMNVVAPGQSGDFRSPHFADQLPLYTSWRYKKMLLKEGDQRQFAESITYLDVP